MELFYETAAHVFYDEAGHIDGVLSGGIRRCVGQIQFFQIRRRHLSPDGRGEDVDALIYSVKAYDLSAEDSAGFRTEERLDGHIGGAGIIGGVGGGEGVDLIAADAGGFCRLFVEAGGSRRHAEQLDDGGTLGTCKCAFDAADVVGRDAALLIGGTGQ